MTGRSVPEWLGKTDDAMPPPRVRLRVFEAHGGVCAISGRKIMAGEAWDLDHRVPLSLGGENREANLQPVLKEPHREKTRADVAAKAKAQRIAKKRLGIEPKGKQRLPGGRGSKWKRRIDGTVIRREDA